MRIPNLMGIGLHPADGAATSALKPVVPPTPPDSLRQLDQWIVWKYVYNDKTGRNDKKPFSPKRGRVCNITNQKNWASYQVAEDALRRGYTGLGIVLAPPLVGIDLDGYCRDEETGAIDEWAKDIIKEIDSYTEASPSGTGVHIVAKGVLPIRGRKADGIELYSRNRFFTYTGEHVAGTPRSIEERHHPIVNLHKRYFPPLEPRVPVEGKALVKRDDSQVLARASVAFAKFARLYEGDWQTYFKSQNSADTSFLNYLTFFTRDLDQMDRIMRSSGLYREKWERADYSSNLIERVIADSIAAGRSVDKLLIPLQKRLWERYRVCPDVSAFEWMAYRNRYSAEIGELQLPKVDLIPLPEKVRPSVRKVYEGFRLRLQVHWITHPGESVMYSGRFAEQWVGTRYRHVNTALRWLVDSGYMQKVELRAGSPYKLTPLYLPGDGMPPRRGEFVEISGGGFPS